MLQLLMSNWYKLIITIKLTVAYFESIALSINLFSEQIGELKWGGDTSIDTYTMRILHLLFTGKHACYTESHSMNKYACMLDVENCVKLILIV